MDNKIRELLAGYVDGELPENEKQAFERELEKNPELRRELSEFRNLKEVTDMVHYADLPDEVWEGYWASIYRKLERGLGWILTSIGAIIVIGYALFQGLGQFYFDPQVPLIIKIGVGALAIGLVVLVVSLVRERLFAYRRDRYKEVTK